MVDIHCHILPGLDDGPSHIDESLAMAEAAIAEGVTHIVATPHSSNEFGFNYSRVRQLRDELQAKIGNRLMLATGCDFHLSLENLTSLRKQAPPFCINQRSYLLVEFSEFSIPPTVHHTLHEMQTMGLRPVITHPERNAILQGQPSRLAAWVQLGCVVQVTAGSLTGAFGHRSQEDALRWIAQGMVHVVATDAHNMTWRPYTLQPAYDLVGERFGESKARALFLENPMAILVGRELPHIPEMTPPQEPVRRKRFRFF